MSDDDPHADRIPSPSSIESPPATSLDYEDFELESKIGTGGSADVWRTRITDNEQVIAVKRPQLDRTLSTERVEQLQQEARTWATLADHSHIVGIVDYGAEPVPWIAMEYMDGGPPATTPIPSKRPRPCGSAIGSPARCATPAATASPTST